ncbi:hypothetical protein [Roseitranquillus sediminis]|uniref:hypothetical protein n=1 Tax=Roseitranquillus sediminis TaxID=2809051 RepID=UPI001D0C69EB|nr:hypothetical protein [Roseitranquillus sediminis]MBM9594179.1 hypothetical protein [Roseitranquillus sediminis]
MTASAPIRGGTPVTWLEDLPPPEALVVQYLRDWCADASGRARTMAHATAALGEDEAERALHCWGELINMLTRYGQRTLVLNGSKCRSVGSDEAVFAHFVTTAALGEREEAMLIASLLVRADLLCPAVHLAQSAGLAIARIALRAARTAGAMPPAPTRH